MRKLLLALLLLIPSPVFASFAYTTTTPFVVQAGQMPASQTNFTFRIYWQDNVLKSVANGGQVTDAQCDDVVPFSDSGLTSQYASFSIVLCDLTGGYIEMDVKITGGDGTTIYLGVGDSGITTFQGGSQGAAYDGSTHLVIPMPNGATLDPSDFSSSNNDGALEGSPTAAAGQVDGAASLNGSTQDIQIGDNTNLSPGTGDLTVCGWAYTTDKTVGQTVWRDYSATTSSIVILDLTSSNFRAFFRDDASTTVNASTTTTLSNTTWYYVCAVRNGTTVRVYLNGAEEASATDAGLGTVTVGDSGIPAIGAYRGGSSSYWSGRLDNVVISQTARSANWLLSEYHNMNNMATFWGSPVFGVNGGGGGTANSSYYRLQLQRSR
jgi:concanavalin A-like lectin/glucanase superfamily protein